MTVQLHDERTYDAAPRAVYELLIDPGFQEARSKHLGTIAAACTRRDETSTKSVVIELDETRDTGFAPHVFRTLSIFRWDPEALAATWHLSKIEGPGDAQAAGTLIIEPIDRRARVVLDGELEVGVKYWGKLIERMARRALGISRAKEAAFIAARLGRV